MNLFKQVFISILVEAAKMKHVNKSRDILKVETNPYKLISTKDARYAIINSTTKCVVATFDRDEIEDAEQGVKNRNAMHQKNLANHGKYISSLKGDNPKFYNALHP